VGKIRAGLHYTVIIGRISVEEITAGNIHPGFISVSLLEFPPVNLY
jgi:hypothetical protein